jgi:GT2 family glycosyltransferase
LNTDTLPRIRACFENDPSLVAVCGEYDLKPANPSFSTDFKAVLSRSWAPPGGVITVFVARIGAIKKRVFEEMDGFDVSIKTASSEEWEFARRLNDKGYTIRYDPAITARHHFPPFGKLVGLFFHRAFMWIYVFKKHGGFDNTCTTPWQAMAQATGFFTTLFLAIAAVHQVFLYASFLSLLAFVLLNLKFFAIAAKAKGYLFALASLPLMLILASATFLGGMWGLFYYYVLHTGSDSANASFGT